MDSARDCIFIRLDGPGTANVEHCPGCHGYNGPALYRCSDCHGGAMYCAVCIVARHEENPLHRVYKYVGSFFVKTPLLGHPIGSKCWSPERANAGFVALHSNGIHEVGVDFCGCDNAEAAGTHEIQLLRAGWFPATHERPQTCATLAVLDQFHHETLQAKTTMYDFYGILEKLTNNTGDKPPDRYHEWIRMCREYRHLMMLKRGGRARAYDSSGAAGTKSGELAVECPACPRPGINLPDDWESTPPEERHKFTLYLALDACFRLKRRLVSSELKDPALGTGWAYMVEDEEYRAYLRGVTDQKEMNTCSGLAALDHANTKFSRGYSTTGVVMGVCARHEFVQPNGVGDLQRGERFSNVDYVASSILRHKHPALWKLISYDIVCVWSKWFKERLKQLPPLVRIILMEGIMKYAIPKMHLRAHKLACHILYSLNLILGSAQVDGEGIERPWSMIGAVARSTQEMGPSARHGVLDYQWSNWNWQKLVTIVATLRRRMDNGKKEQARQKESFDTFTEEQRDRVPAWKQVVHDFEANPAAKNPYEVKVTGEFFRNGGEGALTRLWWLGLNEAEVRLQFTKEEELEAARGAASLHDVTPSKFMTLGLDLEEEQRRIRLQAELKKANTAGMQIDLAGMRSRLGRRLLRFRKLQATYTPAALQAIGDASIPEDVKVENMPLMLPSALTPVQRETCRAGLPHVEAVMRDAQCRVSLVRLRNQLHVKSRLLIYKKSHSRHQKRNTRSRTVVARNESKIRLHSEKYQMAWEAMRRLRADGDGEKLGWQRLRKDDIKCMEDAEDLERKAETRRKNAERRKKRIEELRDHGLLPAEDDGDSSDDVEDGVRGSENRRKMSWIWEVAGSTGTDAELEDALRIEWSKAYARVRRWNEEVTLLEVEYLRVLVSFEFEALRWDRRARAVPIGVIPWEEAVGAVAFARKQAAMFRDLKRRGEETWTAPPLARGKKKVRAASAPESSVYQPELEEDEEERERKEREDEEEDELVRGDVSDDEELLMGGEADDD
ncbi:hypothetical protein B0H11DRAFT_2166764 [Mycena galericulata]|nr:hypothetical protein B0H11DRAFT_2166764 [Mycena galericulata]